MAMKLRRYRRHNVAAAAVLPALVLILVGCGAGASPAFTASPSAASELPTPLSETDPHDVLLAVSTRGGRCVDGPCGSGVLVDRDGRVHVAAKPPNDLGVVSTDVMTALDEAIRATDFAEVVSHRFTGECPTAYDGQEILFEFATPGGVQAIASCSVEIDYDSPLFAAVKAAVGDMVALPGQ
jgi:hypothetical protein